MSEKIYTEENSEYLLNNQNWHIEDSAWKAKKINNLILKNNLNLKSIVEIGCGAGEILVQLQKKENNKGVLFSGYDIAPDVKNFWETRKNELIKFYNKDLLEENVSFDLLLMIDVFEHVSDYRGFIEKSKQFATYKMYHIPLDISVSSVLRKTFSVVHKNVGHIHYFTKETALQTLKDCGLEIIDFEYTPGAIELETTRKLRTKLMKIPRRILFAINKDFAVRLLGGYSLLVLTK